MTLFIVCKRKDRNVADLSGSFLYMLLIQSKQHGASRPPPRSGKTLLSFGRNLVHAKATNILQLRALYDLVWLYFAL